ncbi:putative LPS assembly protein LptD, partial [Acinetobacter baumannii]
TAYHTTVFVKSIPIFYTPYISFPIDKRRTTGFLSPTYSSSSQGGLALNVPFYWNMAPNYDMTLTPTFFAKRGLMLSDQFR